ncbi:unnamed protein product [Schistocephalus solidus]|uniref:HECT-type E3 ubiquitin transferase TRIP12 n=1 Tax=Schistocephalus solidus TaxID=70667 RepID=A0A183TL96_SCHSO|nr:unnamed protein product [Schistocephalus solidus]
MPQEPQSGCGRKTNGILLNACPTRHRLGRSSQSSHLLGAAESVCGPGGAADDEREDGDTIEENDNEVDVHNADDEEEVDLSAESGYVASICSAASKSRTRSPSENCRAGFKPSTSPSNVTPVACTQHTRTTRVRIVDKRLDSDDYSTGPGAKSLRDGARPLSLDCLLTANETAPTTTSSILNPTSSGSTANGGSQKHVTLLTASSSEPSPLTPVSYFSTGVVHTMTDFAFTDQDDEYRPNLVIGDVSETSRKRGEPGSGHHTERRHSSFIQGCLTNSVSSTPTVAATSGSGRASALKRCNTSTSVYYSSAMASATENCAGAVPVVATTTSSCHLPSSPLPSRKTTVKSSHRHRRYRPRSRRHISPFLHHEAEGQYTPTSPVRSGNGHHRASLPCSAGGGCGGSLRLSSPHPSSSRHSQTANGSIPPSASSALASDCEDEAVLSYGNNTRLSTPVEPICVVNLANPESQNSDLDGCDDAALLSSAVAPQKRVNLVVDGVRFVVDVAVLQAHPNTMLGRMFSSSFYEASTLALGGAVASAAAAAAGEGWTAAASVRRRPSTCESRTSTGVGVCGPSTANSIAGSSSMCASSAASSSRNSICSSTRAHVDHWANEADCAAFTSAVLMLSKHTTCSTRSAPACCLTSGGGGGGGCSNGCLGRLTSPYTRTVDIPVAVGADISATVFRVILDYYLTGKMSCPPGVSVRELKRAYKQFFTLDCCSCTLESSPRSPSATTRVTLRLLRLRHPSSVVPILTA